MRIPHNPCYILHHRNFRETSMILEIFSRDHGRLSLVARGVRSRRYRNRHLLQINRRLHIAWSMKGEMGTLVDVEADGAPCQLQGGALMSAFYIHELIMRLLHRHEAHPELYSAYEQALSTLNTGEDEQHVLRIFEKHLLSALGYGLVLNHDMESGRAIEAEREYHYRIDRGPFLNEQPDGVSLRITGRTLIELEQNHFSTPAALRQAKTLMRLSLDTHLGGKPLASRELYTAYIRNRTAIND